MGATTIERMGRAPGKLSPEFRRQLRRASKRAGAAEDALRQTVREGLEAGEPLSAIARELGLTKQVLWARVRSWEKEETR